MCYWKPFFKWNPRGSLHVGAMTLEYNIRKGLLFPFMPPLSRLPVGTISHRCDKCQKAFQHIECAHDGLKPPPRERTNVPMETEIQSKPSDAWAHDGLVYHFERCNPATPKCALYAEQLHWDLGLWTTWIHMFLSVSIANVLCQYITFNV